MEAQRYPEDFDAIVAGAPVYNQIHLNESQVALQVAMLREPSRLVPANKVTLFANAVVAACDEKDGVKDGIVSEPRSCRFDPAVLACKAGDAADCLTDAQVASAKSAWTSVTTKSGAPVYPAHSPGFESGWRIPTPGAAINPLFADMPHYIGRQDANWDVMTFDLDTDLALAIKNAGFIEASDPDLSRRPRTRSTTTRTCSISWEAARRMAGCVCFFCPASGTAAEESDPIKPTSSVRSSAGATPGWRPIRSRRHVPRAADRRRRCHARSVRFRRWRDTRAVAARTKRPASRA